VNRPPSLILPFPKPPSVGPDPCVMSSVIDDAGTGCHSLPHRSEPKPRCWGALPRCSHPHKTACHLLCDRSAAKQSPEDPPSVPAV